MPSVMATPGRRLRSRAGTPLPAVPSKASNAYGAQGKASLHTQVTTTATAFDNAFEIALPRPSVPAPKLLRRTPRKSRSVAPDLPADEPNVVEPEPQPEEIVVAGPAVATHFHDHSDSLDERPGTAIQTSAIYGADLPAPPRVPPAKATTDRKDSSSSGVEFEPNRIQVFLRTLPRYLPRLLRDANSHSKKVLLNSLIGITLFLGVSTVVYGLFSYAPLPDRLALRRDALIRDTTAFFGVSHEQLPRARGRNWYSTVRNRFWGNEFTSYNMTTEQYQMNIGLLSRIERLESRLIELGDQVNLHQETLTTLQDMIPSAIVVRRVDGKWNIESHFWNALADRLSQGESAPLWKAFLQANEEKLATLNTGMTSEALDKAVRDGHVVSAASFSKLVDENFQWLRSKYREDFEQMQNSHMSIIQSIANQTALEVFNRSPLSSYAKTQLETLVKANQIHTAYEALRTPNYFSPGMGARIDHHLTSPTMQNAPSTWVQWLWTHLSPIQYDKHPPIAALQRWEEATDCWCSSPSSDDMGKAQLTVTMPSEIYPDVLVVEHIPGPGTLDISAAPQELEIWADLESRQRAQQVVAGMTEHVPFYSERSSKCGKPPTPNFVCIGKALYDIHSHKYVQSFPVWADAPHLNLSTKKITVRVTQNWGGQWTCIYRLRMTGTRPQPESDATISPPKML